MLDEERNQPFVLSGAPGLYLSNKRLSINNFFQLKIGSGKTSIVAKAIILVRIELKVFFLIIIRNFNLSVKIGCKHIANQ